MESKEKFEPGKSPGTPYKVKLVDTKEFWSKEHPKWGWSYGYNVVVDGRYQMALSDYFGINRGLGGKEDYRRLWRKSWTGIYIRAKKH